LLDSDDCLVIHFGMTGFLKYFKNEEKEPPHDRLLISFANGYHLAYDSQRKLGQMTLVEDFDRFIEEKGLGPHALAPQLDFDAFKKIAAGRRGSIKSLLMNQAVIAGIGNIYADEILFQARIHPKSPADTLSDKRLRHLFAARKRVLKTAIAHQANPRELPRSYIIPRRSSDRRCPKCRRLLKKTTISGRTTYYCPGWQGP
jgi:formamidopyrimidine-DNA glycosylase